MHWFYLLCPCLQFTWHTAQCIIDVSMSCLCPPARWQTDCFQLWLTSETAGVGTQQNTIALDTLMFIALRMYLYEDSVEAVDICAPKLHQLFFFPFCLKATGTIEHRFFLQWKFSAAHIFTYTCRCRCSPPDSEARCCCLWSICKCRALGKVR